MKIAISGKGGVGKTSLSAVLAHLYALEGKKVLTVDADPDANLAQALGLPEEMTKNISPISEMKELIEERTGAKPGEMGGIFKLNPRVDDIPERFAQSHAGVRLLVMGGIKSGGGGCVCPENVLLKNLMARLLVSDQEILIMDMEAGIEHLGRGTAKDVDAFIVVVEPSRSSIETAKRIRVLASEIGVKEILVVANKVRGEQDRRFLKEAFVGSRLLGFISYNERLIEADLLSRPVFEDEKIKEEVGIIKDRLDL